MEKHIYDDKNGLGYTLYGDYYLPDLELMGDEEACLRKVWNTAENLSDGA